MSVDDEQAMPAKGGHEDRMAPDPREWRMKPRGRQLAARVGDAAAPVQHKLPWVEFSIGKSDYSVSVVGMVQRNLQTGHRRKVQRRGAVWYYDSSNSAKGKLSRQQEGPKWVRYDCAVQRLLEDALQKSGLPAPASGPEQVDGGAAEQEGVREGAAARALAAPEGSLSAEVARAALDEILAPGVPTRNLLQTLEVLVVRHGIRCTRDDVRCAVLSAKSLAALQLMLRSNPDLALMGLDVFERRSDPRFAGLKINSDGLKRCLKAVLARGARLGDPSSTPASKLLRKIEKDAFPEWVQRYFASMARAGMELPESLQARVEAFLRTA